VLHVTCVMPVQHLSGVQGNARATDLGPGSCRDHTGQPVHDGDIELTGHVLESARVLMLIEPSCRMTAQQALMALTPSCVKQHPGRLDSTNPPAGRSVREHDVWLPVMHNLLPGMRISLPAVASGARCSIWHDPLALWKTQKDVSP
jgi:hypothetical protein